MRIIVLAAGLGTRLGRPHPKPLTRLADGMTILDRQLALYARVFPETEVTVAVGHKLEDITERYPEIPVHYNAAYATTNTAKTLLGALHGTPADEGVLWANGDLVFDEEVLRALAEYIEKEQSAVVVDTSVVGEEEVKYRMDDGFISELAKTIPSDEALGEAVGINYVSPRDKGEFLFWLDKVGQQDYFEKAMTEAIQQSGVQFAPVDITGHLAIEVDTIADLATANAALPGDPLTMPLQSHRGSKSKKGDSPLWVITVCLLLAACLFGTGWWLGTQVSGEEAPTSLPTASVSELAATIEGDGVEIVRTDDPTLNCGASADGVARGGCVYMGEMPERIFISTELTVPQETYVLIHEYAHILQGRGLWPVGGGSASGMGAFDKECWADLYALEQGAPRDLMAYLDSGMCEMPGAV